MRQSGRLQARCQKMIAPAGRILREKFSRRPKNPHGFELRRTLSCRNAGSNWRRRAAILGLRFLFLVLCTLYFAPNEIHVYSRAYTREISTKN